MIIMKKMLRNILCLLLIISIEFGCSIKNVNKGKPILSYLDKNFSEFNSKDKACILLLTEDGCIHCNQAYAKFLKSNFINKKKSYIIICASGAYVDLAPFNINGLSKNVYEDKKETFKKKIFPYSSAIFLDNKKIDTIIQITSKETTETFDFIIKKYNTMK